MSDNFLIQNMRYSSAGYSLHEVTKKVISEHYYPNHKDLAEMLMNDHSFNKLKTKIRELNGLSANADYIPNSNSTITIPTLREYQFLMLPLTLNNNEAVLKVDAFILGFPILIGQSSRPPGKEEDGVTAARDMYCYKMSKQEILAKFGKRDIRDSDQFENADIHFERFEEMARTFFSQNNIKLLKPEFPEDLSEECYTEKVPEPVNVNLEGNIMSMIDHFRNGNGENYSNYDLTTAVLCHESTIRFFNEIRARFVDEIKVRDGKINNIKLYTIQQPFYNTWADRLQGLTIALNGTWAYEVWITDYKLEKDRSYNGKMKIIIYDHFGLDNEDVSPEKAAYRFDGFYHWFALQHWEGFNEIYKPFVTVIEKELPFRGKL